MKLRVAFVLPEKLHRNFKNFLGQASEEFSWVLINWVLFFGSGAQTSILACRKETFTRQEKNSTDVYLNYKLIVSPYIACRL